MRKVGVFTGMALAGLLYCSCGHTDSYVINGTVEGSSDGDHVYLMAFSPEGKMEKSDSAEIKAQKFEFKGVADTPEVCALSYGNDEREFMTEFVLENGKIDVKMGDKPSVRGTAENDLYDELKVKVRTLNDSMSEVQNQLAACSNESMYKELVDKLNSDYDNMMNELKSYAQSNMDKVSGAFTLEQIMNYIGIDELDSMVKLIPASMDGNGSVKRVKQEHASIMATAPGKKIVDFTMEDKDSITYRFSELVAQKKVTFVDFWASWCGPCMREVPGIKALYEKYKDKDFQIIGISLDENKTKWLSTVAGNEMGWLQLSDLKGWRCHAAVLYHVRSIPCFMLVRQDGTILSKGLTLEETEKLIDENLR